ncbi:hypothetical protein WICPIJ_006274 [Wickerhamomyces pijperi]|uniref:Uncharacterized protein n=1 Tax=Wickerhamomyces pijperi TaxID=599730 RepID=A0A9P8TL65_WICPI|nr:hypothetical protein WICPIJ_006274 [Wickerhamomyces pijperi]
MIPPKILIAPNATNSRLDEIGKLYCEPRALEAVVDSKNPKVAARNPEDISSLYNGMLSYVKGDLYVNPSVLIFPMTRTLYDLKSKW